MTGCRRINQAPDGVQLLEVNTRAQEAAWERPEDCEAGSTDTPSDSRRLLPRCYLTLVRELAPHAPFVLGDSLGPLQHARPHGRIERDSGVPPRFASSAPPRCNVRHPSETNQDLEG